RRADHRDVRPRGVHAAHLADRRAGVRIDTAGGARTSPPSRLLDAAADLGRGVRGRARPLRRALAPGGRARATLRLISDEAFAAGLARYEAHCRQAPSTPRAESLEFFAFRRA